MLASIVILIATLNAAISIEGPPHLFPQLPRTGKVLIARPPAFSPYALEKLKTLVVNAFDKDNETGEIRPSEELLQSNLLTKIDGNTSGHMLIHTIPQQTSPEGSNLSSHLLHPEHEKSSEKEAGEGINGPIFRSTVSALNAAVDDSKQNTVEMSSTTTFPPHASGEDANERTAILQSVGDSPFEVDTSLNGGNDNRQIESAIERSVEINDKDMKITSDLSRITGLRERDFHTMNSDSRPKSIINQFSSSPDIGINMNEDLGRIAGSSNQEDKTNTERIFAPQLSTNDEALQRSTNHATTDVERNVRIISEKSNSFEEENKLAVSDMEPNEAKNDERYEKENKKTSLERHSEQLQPDPKMTDVGRKPNKETSEAVANTQRSEVTESNMNKKQIRINGTEISSRESIEQQMLLLVASGIPLTSCNPTLPFERNCHLNESSGAIECVERFRNSSCSFNTLQQPCSDVNLSNSKYSIDTCRKFRILGGRIHDLIEFPCRQVDLSALTKDGTADETNDLETRTEIAWREPAEDFHSGILKAPDSRLEWEPEEGDKKIVLSKSLEMEQKNGTASGENTADAESNIHRKPMTKGSSDWRPFEMDCNTERDEFSTKCRYWALAGYCTNNKATKFLWCRKTCLCVGPPSH